jgi:hypothetical protein
MACATLFPVAGTKSRERAALSEWTRPPRVLAGFNPLWPDLNFTVAGFDMSASELNWRERV